MTHRRWRTIRMRPRWTECVADRTWLEPPRGPAPHPHSGVGVAGVTALRGRVCMARVKSRTQKAGAGAGAWCACAENLSVYRTMPLRARVRATGPVCALRRVTVCVTLYKICAPGAKKANSPRLRVALSAVRVTETHSSRLFSDFFTLRLVSHNLLKNRAASPVSA